MTDNKIIGAFKRLLTMTLALVMVLGASMPLMTQESYAAFTGKKGSKYTVYDGGQIRYGSGEGGYNALRENDSRHLPQLEITLYYKNATAGCFVTSSLYTLNLDENNENTVKEWHTFLDSVDIRYKEEIDQMRRTGDYHGTVFSYITEKINHEIGNERTIEVKCFESVEKFYYNSISYKDYEKAIEDFNYPRRILKASTCFHDKMS